MTLEQQHILRPTEAQLRWAQFHHHRVAARVKDQVTQMYMQPSDVTEVPNTIQSDLENLDREENEHKEIHNSSRYLGRLKISTGRQVLLRVSQRCYEERRQRIALEGFCNGSCNDVHGKSEVEIDDSIDSIFAESKVRTKRKRRRSMKFRNDADTERIRRFEAAFCALLSSLAAAETKNTASEKIIATKKWTRPEGVTVNVSVDGREYSDLKWGIVGKSSSSNIKSDGTAPIDRGASWMVHIPQKTAKFSDAMRLHLQDVARQYLMNQDENEKVADDDDVASFVDHFERHVTDNRNNNSNDDPTPVTPRDIASFVATFEQQQRRHDSDNNVVQVLSPTTADLVCRFENQQEKDGFVQRLVSEIERAVAEQSPSNLVSADGKLHKPTFALLMKRYLSSSSRKYSTNYNRSPKNNLQDSKNRSVPSTMVMDEGDNILRVDEKENNGDSEHVSKFVQTFIDNLERDDEVDTIITTEGKLNRPLFEKLVNHYLDEASIQSLRDEEEPIDTDDVTAVLSEANSKPTVHDDVATPVRSTSDVFDRIRIVSAKVKSFRFGRENQPNELSMDGETQLVPPATVNYATNIVGSVSNRVGELFKSLQIKNTTDEAAYSAFRETQDQKRGTYERTDGDVSSQSSFRVLPVGIRNAVKGIRGMAQIRSRNEANSEHKREMDKNSDAEDEELFDDVESGTDFSPGDDHHLQSALVMGISSAISGSMDTDGSTVSGTAPRTDRKGVASLMLSPTLLTKRHQQAIRAVESYNWAQVKYLLSANPWLAEMADVNTNQFILHKLAYFGSGMLSVDEVTGEVVSLQHPPASEQLNVDLVNLFPSSVHKLDQDGNLPLHMAASSANLVRCYDFDYYCSIALFSIDEKIISIKHLICLSQPMIQLLCERFSSGASVRNEDGMLPLHLAIIACAAPIAATIATNIEIVDIVQAITKVFPVAIGVVDNNGNLPIHTAASLLRGSQGACECTLHDLMYSTWYDSFSTILHCYFFRCHILFIGRSGKAGVWCVVFTFPK
jgi:hypothetical protein